MIECAVIGVGNMGKNHVRVYSELENCKLVAIADPNETLAKPMAERYGCRYYGNYRQMLQSEAVDAVSIAAPTSMHRQIALDCIDKGMHILLEKPIAGTLEDAETITRKAEECGVTLQVGHIEHFNPAVIKLKEVLKQNSLGKLLTIVIRRVGITPPQIKDANVIVELAIHDIELCNYLTTLKPDKIYCRAGNGLLKDREDYADIFLEYDGLNVMIQSNWITPVKIRKMHLTGTQGYAELDFIHQKLSLAKTMVESNYDDFGAFTVKFGQSGMEEMPVEQQEPLRLEIQHFVESIVTGEAPEVSGQVATDALQTALQAWESHRTKTDIRNAI